MLPYLDRELIMAFYRASPGNEEASGKFENPHSSASLAANFFGFFADRPGDFPGLPNLILGDEVISVLPEQCLRFPWTHGTHPWLDAVIRSGTMLVAIESKRYEPFRRKKAGTFAAAYFRRDWGPGMARFVAMRDALAGGAKTFAHLDAAQLVKHAFGLITQARKSGLAPVLYYIHAEPARWLDGQGPAIPEADIQRHREEVEEFAESVLGDEVQFLSGRYSDALAMMSMSPIEEVRRHGAAVSAAFAPLSPSSHASV